MPIPAFTEPLGLQAAYARILNPPDLQGRAGVAYEHHVGSWATTKIAQHFSHGKWLITPEQALPVTNTQGGPDRVKKPDIIVEEAYLDGNDPTPKLRLHAAFEFKKVKGDRFEKALYQLKLSIEQTVSEMGYGTNASRFEVFAVVMSGERIGFFEYHHDESNLDEEGIPNFEGFVSLTESYEINDTPSTILDNGDIPVDLEYLYHDFDRLRTLADPAQQGIRDNAREYSRPCIFNIGKHAKEVEYLFNHIESNVPRSSV
jgi:hypothetical protein